MFECQTVSESCLYLRDNLLNNFFIIRLFVGSAWSFVFFIPATTANSIPDLIHYIIFLSEFLRKSQYFPF